jgi:hypothetical protein
MKRRKIVTAVRGVLTGRGETKTAAKADLDAQIDWALRSHEPFVESRYGHLIVIAATPAGWQSMVLDRARIAEHGTAHTATCLTGTQETREAVIESSRIHAAQLAWTHAADDDAHVAASGASAPGQADLRRWIDFQRSYKKHLDAGDSPARAHALACGYLN